MISMELVQHYNDIEKDREDAIQLLTEEPSLTSKSQTNEEETEEKAKEETEEKAEEETEEKAEEETEEKTEEETEEKAEVETENLQIVLI